MSSNARHKGLANGEHSAVDAAIGRELKSLDNFFSRLQVETLSDNAELEAYRMWKKNVKVERRNSTILQAARPQPREFLSRPVRHELNKFYYDITSHPSRTQLKKLWEEMNLLQIIPYIEAKKIVKWFQNKRNYIKRLEERDAPITRDRERIRFESQIGHHSPSSRRRDSSSSESSSESDSIDSSSEDSEYHHGDHD